MKFIATLFHKLTNLYLLLFSFGVLLASTIYFKMESTYESEIFGAIAHFLVRDSIGKNNTDTFILRALDIANEFEHNRLDVFARQEIKGLKANLFHPVTMDLVTGNGACGSASAILARILKANAYKVRFAQMKVGNIYGGHIVIEVYRDQQWIVLDPLFNLYFKDSTDKYASFKDVQTNFEYYKKQLPPDYPAEYKFEDVRYTNWDKIKIIGPIAKKILDLFIGEQKASEISIRSFVLRNYYICFLASFWLLIVNIALIGWRLYKSRQ